MLMPDPFTFRAVPRGMRRAAAAAVLAAASCPAIAGVTYRLDRPAAASGETVRLEAIFFNDGDAVMRWEAPRELVVQWRNANGGVVRSLATLPGDPPAVEIPVNNFARVSWNVVVPVQARGMQAVSIEGESAMLALEATGRSGSQLAATPADVPVTDALTGQPVAPAGVTQAGASPAQGSAPAQVAAAPAAGASASPFESFRSAITPYQPMYFSVGTRGGTTARFQISAKYRVFTPPSDRPATFAENFYLGYTQTSLWDLEGDSRPFIDTTFNPSVFWLSDNLWQSASRNWRLGLNTGVEHNSNGKDGDDSRSFNDAYVQPALNYRFDGGSTLTFAPKFKQYFGKGGENHDYADYAGYVDWNLRWAQDNGAVVSAMYRQGDQGRRTTQLDFAWPLQRTWLDMNGYLHLQYFNGYGETLLGYNQRNESQFRIGLSIVP
ncbi:phospholipase A [Bordetella sp. 2513F-2]